MRYEGGDDDDEASTHTRGATPSDSGSFDDLNWDARSGEQWVDAKKFFEEEDIEGSGDENEFSWLGKESNQITPTSATGSKGKGKQKSRK